MQRCPIEGCGRQFQNQMTMIQHVKRRHPLESENIRQKTMNDIMQKQHKINQQMSKLPKMQRIIQMSKQKKTIDFQRRSSSKKRKQLVSIIENSQIKLNEIITQSRQIVDQTNSNSRKLLRRPSLSKKTSQQSDNKLPSLNQVKGNKLKLQNLKSSLNHSTISRQTGIISKNNQSIHTQKSNAMYSTAPNFTHQMNKKIQLLKSRSKGKQKDQQQPITNRQSSKDLKKLQKKDVIHKKTLSSNSNKLLIGQNLINPNQKLIEQKSKPIQRPIKKLLQRNSIKKDKQSHVLQTQSLSQSTFIENNNKVKETKKFNQLVFSSSTKQSQNRFTKKQAPLHSPTSNTLDLQQWKQKTVTMRNKNHQFFSIPEQAQVQYLYVINCQVKELDLNECFSLIELSLINNKIQSLGFLQQTVNGGYQNLEALYIDNNNLSSIESLPTYLKLKKLSVTFNKITGLDQAIKILVKFPQLEEIDFSFNPLRQQTNYKLAIISACRNLKKLDGMTITKYDKQLSNEYNKIYYENINIIPLNNNNNFNSSYLDDKFRPSTAVSINYQQDLQPQNIYESNLSDQQLDKQIQTLQKLIKNTKQQLQIIQNENQVIQEQIKNNEPDLEDGEQKQQFNEKIYKKLLKQCQQLQLLNFFQYASQKQLQDLLFKKAKQKGISLQTVLGN